MSPEGKEIKIGLILSALILMVIGGFYYNYRQGNKPLSSTRNSVTDNTKPTTQMLLKLTSQEIAKHNQPSDCVVIIADKVYNVTSFLNSHPGGPEAIIPYCGADATVAFNNKGGGGHSDSARRLLQPYLIGSLW